MNHPDPQPDNSVLPTAPHREDDRLAALDRYGILDTPAETEFDDFTALASLICGTPIALISLVDAERQWFKSKLGLDVNETPRNLAFCAHAIRGTGLMEVPNALEDARFRTNPLVTGAPNIRFYAGTPLTTPDGHNLGTLCVIYSVRRQLTPEQRQAMAQLGRGVVRQMELRLANVHLAQRTEFQEALLQSAAAAIISTDLDGTITSFNRAAEDLLGYPAAELVGRSNPGAFHLPEEVAARAEELSRELGRPVPPGFEVFVANTRAGGPETREWTYVRRDGSRVPVLLSVSAIRNTAGEATGFLGVARDLTDRKRSQEVQAQLAAIVEYSDDAILSSTRDGIVTSWNAGAGRLFGYASSEMVGQPLSLIIPPDRREEEHRIAERVLCGDPVEHFETQRRRRDGVLVDVSVTSSATKTADGRITGVSQIVRDITGQKRTQAKIGALHAQLQHRARQLESANRELTDFAYIVSHDLKAPLRGISTLAGWLATDSRDKLDADGREQLDLLQTRVRRLDGLINGILAYSRAGRTREEPVVVDLEPLVRNVIDLLEPPAHIRIEVETPLPAIRLEAVKTQQLFQNLLSNAIMFMDKPAGLIRVRGFPEAGGWHFLVTDNGPGIEAKYFDRIFQLFQTLAPRDQVESTGVGLSIVKKIVDGAGGRVWVESQPGLGTTFHFTLPDAAHQPAPLNDPFLANEI